MKEFFKILLTTILVSLGCCGYAYILSYINNLIYLHPIYVVFLPVLAILLFYLNKYKIKKIFIPYVNVVITWFSHLVGASIGKEGVGIDFAKSISRQMYVFRISSKNYHKLKLYEALGVISAFASLFVTPFAGVVFLLETEKFNIQKKDYFYIAFVSLLSFFISEILGSHAIRIVADNTIYLNFNFIFCSICVVVFSLLVSYFYKKLYKAIKNIVLKYKLVAIVFFSIIFVAISYYSYSIYFNSIGKSFILNGLSVKMFDYTFAQTSFNLILFMLVAKVLMTSISVTIGFKGGEFVPYMIFGLLSAALVSSLFSINSGLILALGTFVSLSYGKKIPVTSLVLFLEVILHNFFNKVLYF